MAEEMIFTINLRDVKDLPRGKRAPKAVKIVKEFLERHMKGEVKIGKYLNQEIWARGAQKPPQRVSIKAVKDGDIIRAELIGEEVELELKKEERRHAEKSAKEKKNVKEKTPEPLKDEPSGEKTIHTEHHEKKE